MIDSQYEEYENGPSYERGIQVDSTLYCNPNPFKMRQQSLLDIIQFQYDWIS